MIVNPASADGRTGRLWPRHEALFRRWLPEFEVWTTTGPGHARQLAGRAAQEGRPVVAVHGGDGTFNEAVNGLLDQGREDIPLAFLPHGTGADLVRTLGIPHRLPDAARRAGQGTPKPIDLGKVEFVDLEGKPTWRYFVNVADVGFGGELVRFVNTHSKRWGGRFTFFRGLLVTLFRYRNKELRVTASGVENFSVKASSVVVANGQYFGGGMWVAPGAAPDDGLFELVIIGDATRTEVLTNIGLLYRGTIARHPKVRVLKTDTVVLDSAQEVWIDLDGEWVGRLPARFTLQPGGISILR